jgi:tryptophanyl-tRNA synthetase
MNKKFVFSGIKPTGELHIGHYIGAVKNWLPLQDEYECLFSIVDLHAITVPEAVKGKINNNIYNLLAIYLAFGLDPNKSKILLQSDNPDHSYLAWILNCFTPFGLAKRMTQFKEKSDELKESISCGLFSYPMLQAADILLYDTDLVPVGEDQRQHVEIAKDIAQRFNKMYEPVFKLPEPLIEKGGARIKDLYNIGKKMSKSSTEGKGIIFLLDKKEDVYKKILKAPTDSKNSVKYVSTQPEISNLIDIYTGISGLSIKEIETKYIGLDYKKFKEDLADIVWNFLEDIQTKYNRYINDIPYLNSILDEGLAYSLSITQPKVKKVREVLGIVRKLK